VKILIINEFCGTGSTGKICGEIAKKYENAGDTVKIAYGREGYVPEEYKKYAIRIGNDFTVRLHGLATRIFDAHGYGSIFSTKKFLKWADDYNPDMIWLHNLHGYYINIIYLFEWIKKRNIVVKWTLHDCWAFTGHCPHFAIENCYKWKSACGKCPQLLRYPASFFYDGSNRNYNLKRKLFTGIENLQIITPSLWLADLVKESFLNCYDVKVIPNKVNKAVFRPIESSFREQYDLKNKRILLGVASVWDNYKGFNTFLEISQLLSAEYSIVLVGVNEKQISQLPDNVIGIKKTHSQEELVEIYSAADLFLNLSREETYGMTVAEAILCGTIPIVYENTACEEVVKQYNCGIIVEPNVDAVIIAIKKYFSNWQYVN